MRKDDQNKGLYNKYKIEKTNGEPIDEDAKFFVLRIDLNQNDKKHMEACRIALRVYAREVKEHIPKLSKDLLQYLGY